jgi:methyl-accepting chemotaxis protein
MKLRLSQVMTLGIAAFVAALLVIGLVSVFMLERVASQLELLIQDRVVKVQQLRDIKDNVNITARAARNILLAPNLREAETKRLQEATTRTAKLFATLDQSVQTPQGRELLAKLDKLRITYDDKIKGFLANIESGDDLLATTALLSDVRPVQTAYFDAVDEMVALQTGLMTTTSQEAEDMVRFAEAVLIGVGLLAVLGGAFFGWWLVRKVTAPLGGEPDEVNAVTGAIASGDLSSNIDASRARPGSIVASMTHMQQSLRSMVGQVRASSQQIATGSEEIATGTLDLSARTEAQASNLEQTAASMEELTSTVRATADTARQANQKAQTAAQAAGVGGQRMGEVVSTMRGISEASRKIAEIIGVIDGIAFQTNILALNAAVEAARAGEQGRGFAVVASEVRTLAQRSASAAREIKELINSSVQWVDKGTEQVDLAGQGVQDIVVQVQEVSRLIGEITQATVQQTSGIEQVNSAVTQLDQMTQQNAALVEESSAAAASLKSQAQKLQELVAAFRIEPGTAGSLPQPARQALPAPVH